ncbi:DUF6894 family protein [Pararoseomonas indoligenes]|uniref:DUF6894 domain-containing protein n=1 Tax=Roseomonas indoligenes TaxID=2820811 RepID=A0A940MUP9_9PROT|nr:hypothetical protein [Pararoseomonas indoligenes]MBP0492053.1 hypothetical protein [Pararoseomonas indoligenes]
MPRYFFHVRDGQSLPDRTGKELPNISAAKQQAVHLAGGLLKADNGAFWSGEEWQMEVVDEAGLVLFTLDFLATESPAVRAGRSAGQG